MLPACLVAVVFDGCRRLRDDGIDGGGCSSNGARGRPPWGRRQERMRNFSAPSIYGICH